MAEPKFHQLHYNFVAKRLRNHYPADGGSISDTDLIHKMGARTAIENLALEFAQRFKLDNLNFDQYAFLDQCSPDPDVIPLSELWEELE